MSEQMLMLISKQLEEISALLNKQQLKTGKIGRPSKKHIVMRYRENYPTGRKMECAKMLGISIKTVSKYWDVHV
jgi:hypothetical protein